MVNSTRNGTFPMPPCQTCQTSNGFSSGDRRSIIVLVVLVSIVLVLCYVGVLWVGFRTRTITRRQVQPVMKDTHRNDAFDEEPGDDRDFGQISPAV